MKLNTRSMTAEKLEVLVFPTRKEMGYSCAVDGGDAIRQAIALKGSANVMFASAPSQLELYAALSKEKGIDWSRVCAFHLDEYIGLDAEAPQCFGKYLRDHLLSLVNVGKAFFLDGMAKDLSKECVRYSGLLQRYPIDVAFLGIGTNGHLAFNDPGIADFCDPVSVKVVPDLDEECRRQQVEDGWFKNINEMPRSALTVTIPAIMVSRKVFVLSPGTMKAAIVRRCLEDPIGSQCPATILRTHPAAKLYLDDAAATSIPFFGK